MAPEEHGSCLNIFWTRNHGQISETFTNYEAKHLLRKSVDHVLTYSGRQMAVGSQKPSRITRQNTCCAWSETRLFALYFRTGEVLMLQLESSWHGRSMDHVLTYFRRQIAVKSQKRSRITRQNTCCANDKPWTNLRNFHELRGKTLVAQVSETCRFALYFRTGVDLMLQLELSWHGRSVDHVLTYSGPKIAVKSQKPSQITRQKTCGASELNTSVRFVFANPSQYDAPIGVFMAWEERGSYLNVFRTTNRGRITETFTNYDAKDLLHMGVKHVSSHDKSRSNFKNLNELRGKTLVAQVSETRRFVLYLRTKVDVMLQLESSWHERSIDHVLTYSGQQIAVKSLKPSRITRQNTCCASERNSSVRVLFVNRSGFDAPVGVVIAWEERGLCLNILRSTNRGRISETFTNCEAKHLLRK
ncbi:uncharacterized protein G2W53_010287 [Senna tora]|uniref:Uncharacterized protein n=1 Tax=Senna tora TaxID=362788 RepID=A0A834WZT5_9FABA|nr:uncharacterized protein G2W53_010287 [Senna tora]